MAVVVDYQNVHLTGASLFLPGRPPEEGLIDPFRFACQLAQARNAKIDDPARHASVERVEVFRGLPIQEDDPDAYRRNQTQKVEWERGHHGVVSVTLRPLKYASPRRRRSSGRGQRDPAPLEVRLGLSRRPAPPVETATHTVIQTLPRRVMGGRLARNERDQP